MQLNLVAFLYQIKEESFLEDVNNLLNAGEVPNLFPLDEKQEICEKMRTLDRCNKYKYLIRGPFLESSENVSDPKSHL